MQISQSKPSFFSRIAKLNPFRSCMRSSQVVDQRSRAGGDIQHILPPSIPIDNRLKYFVQCAIRSDDESELNATFKTIFEKKEISFESQCKLKNNAIALSSELQNTHRVKLEQLLNDLSSRLNRASSYDKPKDQVSRLNLQQLKTQYDKIVNLLNSLDTIADAKSKDALTLLNALCTIKTSNIYSLNELCLTYKARNYTNSNLSDLNAHMVEINRNKFTKRHVKNLGIPAIDYASILKGNLDLQLQECQNGINLEKKKIDNIDADCEKVINTQSLDQQQLNKRKATYQRLKELIQLQLEHPNEQRYRDEYFSTKVNLLTSISYEKIEALEVSIKKLYSIEKKNIGLLLVNDLKNIFEIVDANLKFYGQSSQISSQDSALMKNLCSIGNRINYLHRTIFGKNPPADINAKIAELKDLSIEYLRLENKLMKIHIMADDKKLNDKIAAKEMELQEVVSLLNLDGRDFQDVIDNKKLQIENAESQIVNLYNESYKLALNVSEKLVIQNNPESLKIYNELKKNVNTFVGKVITANKNDAIKLYKEMNNSIFAANEKLAKLNPNAPGIANETNTEIGRKYSQIRQIDVNLSQRKELLKEILEDGVAKAVQKLNKELKLLRQQKNLREHKILAKQAAYMEQTGTKNDKNTTTDRIEAKVEYTRENKMAFTSRHNIENESENENNVGVKSRSDLYKQRSDYKTFLEKNGREFEEYSLVNTGEENAKAKLKTVSHPEGVELKISNKIFKGLFSVNSSTQKLDISLGQGQYGDCYLLSALDSIMNDEEMMVKFLNKFEEVKGEDGKTKLQFKIKLENGEDMKIPFDINENGEIEEKGILNSKNQAKSSSSIVRLMEEAYTIKRLNDVSIELDRIPTKLKYKFKNGIKEFNKLLEEINCGKVDKNGTAIAEEKMQRMENIAVRISEEVGKYFEEHIEKIKPSKEDMLRKQKAMLKDYSIYSEKDILNYFNEAKFVYSYMLKSLADINQNAGNPSNRVMGKILNGGSTYQTINDLLGEELLTNRNSMNKYLRIDNNDLSSMSFVDEAIKRINYQAYVPVPGEPEVLFFKNDGDNLDNMVAKHALGIDGVLDDDIQWVNPWNTKQINTVQIDDIYNQEMNVNLYTRKYTRKKS